MNCVYCGGTTKVMDSRTLENGTRYRWRECQDCGRRFETREIPRAKTRSILQKAAAVLERQDPILANKLKGIL